MALTPMVEELLAYTRKYDAFVANGKQFPSSREEDEDYVNTRQAIIDGSLRLRMAAMTVDQCLHQYLTKAYDVAVMRALTDLNLAPHVPDEGITFADLSRTVGIHERALAKIVRIAICQGVYCEPEPGLVKHTQVSKLFALPGIQSLCRFTIETVLPSMEKLVEASRGWKGDQDPPQSAFDLAHNKDGSMTNFPDEACFKAIMSPADAKGLASYPLWQELDKPGAVFVDVGGNHGYGSLAIAKATKHLRFVVEDMPALVERAQSQESQPGGVLADGDAGHRIELKAYDMFSGPQPVRQADVYFFRAVFHNWSDVKCKDILQNLMPALKAGSRIIICDMVLPERCEVADEQHYSRISDLTMFALHNACERSAQEWKALFTTVDPRFCIKEMYPVWPGSYQKFIHVTLES
ncbi:hypothetical protein MCOR07_001884 [Pyricularia oryzae]|nr:hypothetical protein MCOR32_009752 [Pyricularia oryzae]KAI6544014.1 hypothetical protein MCOR05_002732 [Pyricularia oryzae]KAI6594451.1 hypothetical protein MCOR12_006870 [Pyricularia oryzae]KAI6627573.1 hypothetical protein MCOR07_001884 [Pyricularia oryzae]